MCVLSAVIAVLVILAACIAEITIYYFKPEWLNIWSGGEVNKLNDIKNDTLTYNNNDIVGGGDGIVDGVSTIINEVIEQANVTLIGNLTNVLIGNETETTEQQDDASSSSSKENLGLSINGTIFVIFAATVGLLAAISAGLLLHLCFFHVYISYLGLTTYEYIRQQRSTNVTYPPPAALYPQKNGTTHKKENGSHGNGNGPHNGTNNQETRRYTSFFRSKSAEADFYFCSNVNPVTATTTVQVPMEAIDIESQNRPKTLYCCDRVESHHHRHKAYYMCSVMEDNPVVENSMRDLSRINYYPDDEARYESKTFHCCSEYVESRNDDLVDHPIGTVTGILEQSRREAFLHYTEQCTFCSFRIKTPAKRQHISVEDKRCCIKTVAKHHRWRRKWNCCSNVPDSPDVPMGSQPLPVPQQPVLPGNAVLNVRTINENSLQAAQTNPHDQRNNNNNNNGVVTTTTNNTFDENSANNNSLSIQNGHNNAQTDHTFVMRTSPNNNTVLTGAPVMQNEQSNDIQQIITISSSLSNVSSSSTTTIMPPSTSSSNNPTPSKRMRVRGIRPVIRLRHMFRVLGKRYRRPRCRHASAPQSVKQNQIRPLPGNGNAENNSNAPYNILQHQEASNNGQYSTITHQTILPTSAIRNETIVTSSYTLPALPPPQRRKIRTTESDIQDLADTLTLVQEQTSINTSNNTITTPSTIIRLATPNVTNGHHRRHHSRRKQILRPRSPTLSPIHESGLSNPTSPLPCHRQNSGETPDDEDDEDDDDEFTTTSSISSLANAAHLCAKLNLSPNVSPNKRPIKV